MAKKKARTRRKRRQARMFARSKGKFRVRHKTKSGRTGAVHRVKLKAAIDATKHTRRKTLREQLEGLDRAHQREGQKP